MTENHKELVCNAIPSKQIYWLILTGFMCLVCVGFGLIFATINSHGEEKDFFTYLAPYVFFFVSFVYALKILEIGSLLQEPFLLNATSEGIKLRKVGFIPWNKIEKICGSNFFRYRTGESFLTLTFKKQTFSEPIPFWWRIQRGLYREKGDTVIVRLSIRGATSSLDEIIKGISINYSFYLMKEKGYKPDDKIDHIGQEKFEELKSEVQELISWNKI